MSSAPSIPSPASKHLNSLFSRCGTLRSLRQLHAQLLLRALHLSTFFASRLTNAYFSCNTPRCARQAFDQIPTKNPHSWNTMLAGYSRIQRFSELLQLYRLLRSENNRPDSFSLVFAIRACIGLSHLEHGKSIHCDAIRSGLESNQHVAPSLVNIYIELGCMDDAEKVFDRATVENSTACGLMMKGYLKASMDIQIFYLFRRMKEFEIEFNPCAAVCLARAYGNVRAAKEGRAIHGFCLKKNWLGSSVYLQTSLLDMYCKSGLIDFGCRLFNEMPNKDVVSWSSMVAGLAQCGRAYESLHMFRDMLEESVKPNGITLASLLLACSHLGALQQGMSIHGYMIRNEVEIDVVTCTSLLDMYAKCGSVKLSYKVFDMIPERNVFSWSAMINAYGMHGMCPEALSLFDRMKIESIVPNSVTFIAALSACSHAGKVREGRYYFKLMTEQYNIIPSNEHYSCMVDLLGRAGLINEAESLVRKMPVEPSASIWGALLGACRIHRRVELAEKVANKLFVLEPDQPGSHVLLSNIYAAAEMWDMVKKAREVMDERELRKTTGYSSIEIDKRVYIFNATDKLDGENMITGIWRLVNELCHKPDLSVVLLDVIDEAKGKVLSDHTKKLSLAYGI